MCWSPRCTKSWSGPQKALFKSKQKLCRSRKSRRCGSARRAGVGDSWSSLEILLVGSPSRLTAGLRSPPAQSFCRLLLRLTRLRSCRRRCCSGRGCPGMPGDALFLEKGDGIANRNSSPRRVARRRSRLGERKRSAAQPKTFHKADRGVRIQSQHRRAALSFDDGMAEKKDIGGGSSLIEERGLVRQHRARRQIFALRLKTLRILKLSWVQRKSKYGLASNSRLRRQRDKGHGVAAGKGIRRCSQNSHIVLGILGDDRNFQKARRGFSAVHEDVRLSSVAKRLEDVGDGEEIAFLVDKKGVAEERVVVAAGGRRLVVGVHDRAQCRRGSIRGDVGRRGRGKDC